MRQERAWWHIHCGLSNSGRIITVGDAANCRGDPQSVSSATMVRRFLACFSRSAELSVRLAASHHLLAVTVERVVHDGFGCDHLVVIFEPEMPKTFGDRIQSRGLRLIPQRVVGVSAVYDLCQENNGRIAREAVLECVEGALLAVVSELDALHVIGRRALSLRYV